MCGLFGVLGAAHSAVPTESQIADTVRLLQHRGPDGAGVFAAPGIGLAHTRLALLDLNPRSAQPFWDATGQYCLVYNGEVYNFQEMRTALESEGVHFRTTSDTEVVLESIVRWGLDQAVQRFEGMFAFALFDRATHTIYLVRDRFGIKPLFVLEDGDQFMFASEIQAFRPWRPLAADTRSLISFLYGSGGPTDGRTFFAGIRYLPPGTIMTVSPGRPPETRRFFAMADFWSPSAHAELATRSDNDLVDEVDELLQESVRLQLIADAPVGALCSGGIDSSLLMAIAAKRHDNLAVFHANVVGPMSEYEAARSLASHLDLDLLVAEVKDDDSLDLLPKLTRHHGNPYHLNPHSVPFFKVSELVRDSGVKAVLSGEGADEAYLGYSWLAPGRTQRQSNRTASSPSMTYVGDVSSGSGHQVARFLRRNRSGSALGAQVDLLTEMLGGFETLDDHAANASVANGLSATERTRTVQTLDLLQSNLRGLLHRNDTMGMAASIESRFPFLDSRLIRHAVNLDARSKIRPGFYPRDRRHPFSIDKWVLRKVADRYLPKELSRRPKIPFVSTAYGRMRVNPALFAEGYVADAFSLSAREADHLAANVDRRLMSKLVHLETWGRVFVREETEDNVVRALHKHIAIRPKS